MNSVARTYRFLPAIGNVDYYGVFFTHIYIYSTYRLFEGITVLKKTFQEHSVKVLKARIENVHFKTYFFRMIQLIYLT